MDERSRAVTDVSKDQLREVVTRVVGDVMRETSAHEAAFGVADLQSHLGELAKVGGESAWTISYSTSRTSIDAIRDQAGIGGDMAAWTITYSTSMQGFEAPEVADLARRNTK
jgi:hypothetical protein